VEDQRRPPPSQLAALTQGGPEQDETDQDGPEVTRLRVAARAAEGVAARDLAELSPGEREHLARPARAAAGRAAAAHLAASAAGGRGAPDPGRTLRAALRNHGEVALSCAGAPGPPAPPGGAAD